MLQAGRSRVRVPMRWIFFFNLRNPSSRTMALGSTQPVTEMNTRNLPGGKGRPAHKADLTAICEPIMYKMWEPRRLTTLWAFTACYRDSFAFTFNPNWWMCIVYRLVVKKLSLKYWYRTEANHLKKVFSFTWNIDCWKWNGCWFFFLELFVWYSVTFLARSWLIHIFATFSIFSVIVTAF
jgi:hypothetical protein